MLRKLYRIAAVGTSLLVLLLTAGTAMAQEMKDAVELYNSAAKGLKQDPNTAIKSFGQCIEICKAIDTEEANDLMRKANSLMPRAYYEIAKKNYIKKDFEATVKALESSLELAEKVNDKALLRNINRTLPKVYYSVALNQIQRGEYEQAIEQCNAAIAINRRFIEPVIAIAIAQDSLGLKDSMMLTLKRGLQMAREANNVARQQDIKLMALNQLKEEANLLLAKKQIDKAIQVLDTALTYDDKDAGLYTALAMNYQAKKLYNQVIENAVKAIENAPASLDLAQIYFVKAQAHQALGQAGEACESYKKAASGAFKESAEYQMKEVLHCK